MFHLTIPTPIRAVILICCFLLSNKLYATTLQDISIVTEETPPFIQYNSAGQASGIVADRVNHVLKILGIQNPIQILSWSRAYELTLRSPTTMIFPLARNAERDNLFKYAGVIFNIRTFLFKLASRNDINIKNLEDAKKYRIGAILKDARHTYLVNNQFKLVEDALDSEKNIRKLIGGRVDLIISTELSVKSMVEKIGLNENIITKVLPVTELDGRRYLAFKKEADDGIVSKIKQVVEKEYKSDQ